MPRHEQIGDFGFFNCLEPNAYTDAATGAAVDCQGYEGVTFLVHVGEGSALGSASGYYFYLQETDGSVSVGFCSGPAATWSAVSDAYIVMQSAGADTISTACGDYSQFMGLDGGDDGRFLSLCISNTSQADAWSLVFKVGYKFHGRRYVRCLLSNSVNADCSLIEAAVVAIRGRSHLWPVDTPQD